MNGELSELYQKLILDHRRTPISFRVLPKGVVLPWHAVLAAVRETGTIVSTEAEKD